MKHLALAILFALVMCLAYVQAKAATFEYPDDLTICAATYKEAARVCFRTLTKGKYPGEERGLEIIDICANPIKGEVK